MMQSPRFTRGLLALTLALSACAIPARSLFAEDAADAYSEEKIKGYIGDLGNEDFAKRQAAEKELGKAGVKAQKQLEAVKDSTDVQVKTTAQHLLSKLKFAALPPVDYLDLLPAKSVVVLRAANLAGTVENAKKSAIARMFDLPAFEPFKKKFKDQMDKKPDAEKMVDGWIKRFSGQFAAAILEINPLAQDVKMAAIAEITDPDPSKVYAEMLTEIHLEGQASSYGDVDYIEGPNNQGAAALLGKHVILANNVGALKMIVDAFTTPGKYSTSDNFAKVKPSLGAKPELLATVDIESLIKTLSAVPLPFSIDEILSTSGLKNLKYAAYASNIATDSFEDRIVQVLNGPPTGMNAAYVAPAGIAPLNAAALAPQNAIAIAAIFFDGAKFHAGMMEYLASMRKMKENIQNMGGMPPDNANDPEAQLKKFEETTGLKVADLAATIKGEAAIWVVPATGAIPGAPDIGGVITCDSPEKAAVLSDALIKIANFGREKDKSVVTDNPYKNRVIHQVDVAALNPNTPKEIPYVPAWTVDANRIYVGSTPAVLQKQISNIDTKAPGLLTQQDFVKAIGTLTEEERKGSMLYVDAKTLLTMGATIGLPLLQVQSKDEVLKKALAALPPAADLFKDIPPLIGSSVINGTDSKVLLRAPVPPIPTLITALIAMTLFNNRELLGLGDMLPDEGK